MTGPSSTSRSSAIGRAQQHKDATANSLPHVKNSVSSFLRVEFELSCYYLAPLARAGGHSDPPMAAVGGGQAKRLNSSEWVLGCGERAEYDDDCQ